MRRWLILTGAALLAAMPGLGLAALLGMGATRG